MGSGLISKIKVQLIQDFKSSFKTIWFFSLALSIVIIALVSDEYFLTSAMALALSFLVTCSITFPMATIQIVQYFSLKNKIKNNEHLKTSTYVVVSLDTSLIDTLIEFLFKIKRVRVNGKSIKAVIVFKLKPNQTAGSLIMLPIGCYFIPHSQKQNEARNKVA